jgi:predicted ester cyclase
VAIAVEENGNPVPGSPFTTDAEGRVAISVALDSLVVVTEDSETVPRGYVPLTEEASGVAYANPVQLDPVTEGYQWGLIFVNVPSTSRPTAEPASAGEAPASLEVINTDVVRALYEQVYSQGSLDLIDELYAPNYVEHQADSPAGREGVRSSLGALRAGIPDLTVTIEDITTAGDTVWVRSTMRGTHEGTIFGIPATGRVIEAAWFDVYQVVNGTIVAHWGVGDELGLMQQLGFALVPPTPATAGT